MNLAAPQCSPDVAKVVSLTPGVASLQAGEVQHAGGMQWFRFDEPGTYGFAVDSDGDQKEDDDLKLQVYVSTDLSTPLRGYKDKTVTKDLWDGAGVPHSQTLKEFVIPKAPFYVKVFDPDRTFTGPYGLTAWRASCKSQDEACVLLAGQGLPHTFPGGQALSPSDTAWFTLDTESTGGAAQNLELGAYGADSNLFSVELRTSDGVTSLGNAGAVADNASWKGEVTYATPDAAPYYLLVKRQDPALAQLAYTARWTTDLTMLVGLQGGPGATELTLYVATKTDDVGSDEIYFTVYADGVAIGPEKYLTNLANHEHAEVPIPTPVKFVNELKVVFREDDDNVDELNEVVLKALPRDVSCVLGKPKKAVQTQGTQIGQGEYFFYYNLCHGVTQP